MNHRTFVLAAICAGFSFLALPGHVQAKGIPIIVNWGADFMDERPVPPALKGLFYDATHIGYHCQHFGVFYLTLWTWDGHWCAYNSKLHYEIPDEAAAVALGIPGQDPGKPFFYSFPFGLFLLTVVIGGWTGYEVFKWRLNAWSAARAKRRDELPPDDEEESESYAAAPVAAAAAASRSARPRPADENRQKQIAVEEQVAWMVGEGKAKEAHQLYTGARQNLGHWDLPSKTLLALIVALDREKQHADVLPLLTRYVDLVPAAPTLLRLKLAQLLLTIQPRPSKALEVLDKLDASALDEKSKKIVAQLRTQAERLAADEETELRLAE